MAFLRLQPLYLLAVLCGMFITGAWFAMSYVRLDASVVSITEEKEGKSGSSEYFSLECTNSSQICPKSDNTPEPSNKKSSASSTCPEYFKWIYEDLRPWKETGISRELVEAAAGKACFRLVIVGGKPYVQHYKGAFQTRIPFTIWGILQLLKWYPGEVPDVDLVFNAEDYPNVRKGGSLPLPVFRYCGDNDTVNIVFPDWSFWGWPEVNIKPWEMVLSDLDKANKRRAWQDREPYAYWRGNTKTGGPLSRRDLMKCNVTPENDWGARLYAQVWEEERANGFMNSDLDAQCNHRYRIFIEGSSWSVSDKYILACDSPTLYIKPRYFDFFIRGLKALTHYWPINPDDKCKSLKHAVEWGNKHHREALTLGKAGSSYVFNEFSMTHVYDYMLHALKEYAKLLKHKPEVPPGAEEICQETIACPAEGLMKKFLLDSMVKSPSPSSPCIMPPPYGSASLRSFLERQEQKEKQVQGWEKRYWRSHGLEAKNMTNETSQTA